MRRTAAFWVIGNPLGQFPVQCYHGRGQDDHMVIVRGLARVRGWGIDLLVWIGMKYINPVLFTTVKLYLWGLIAYIISLVTRDELIINLN